MSQEIVLFALGAVMALAQALTLLVLNDMRSRIVRLENWFYALSSSHPGSFFFDAVRK